MNGTITKYRKKDGRVSWGYYFRSGEQQFTKSGFATRDAAVDARDVAIREAQGLPPISNIAKVDASPEAKGDTRKLSEYLDYWLDEHAAPRCAATTQQLYRSLSVHLVQHLGHVRLCDLKVGSIQEMVNRLRQHGGIKTKEHPLGRPLSAKHTHAIASLLHTCLADAVRLEHLLMNPMGNRRVRLPKRTKRMPAVLDPPMLAKLFRGAEGTRLHPFVVVAAATGCRRGELCALTWVDVDFEKATLCIDKSLEQTQKGGLRLKSTKSGRPRFFGLDGFALEVLAGHRESQEKDKANFGRDYHDLGLVFCQPNGYFYSPNRIGARVKELLIKSGLPGFTLHSLRHSHASVLLGQGTPLAVVSERLGHANQTITLNVYSHALPADRKAASNAWQSALAEAIAEGRSRKATQTLGNARKLAVND